MTARVLLVIALCLAACGVQEGDACESGGECVGSSEALLCMGGGIRRTPCRGAAGCTMEGERVRCDRTLAEVGDPCAGGSACSTDSRAFLVCRGGRYAVGAECPAGCLVEGDRVECPRPDIQPPLQ